MHWSNKRGDQAIDLPIMLHAFTHGEYGGIARLKLVVDEDATLAGFTGRVSDSGEGRWTIEAAIDEAVPANVLAAALFARFSSRGESDFGDKLLSALRMQFGGHSEKPRP